MSCEKHKENSQRQGPNRIHYCFRERRNLTKEPLLHYSDLSDDSCAELYKPNRNYINSSDSEITSVRDSSSEAESVANIRLAKPKRNIEKKRRIIHAAHSKHVEKVHISGH